MKTIDRNHKKWNISYTEFTAEALVNLNKEQAQAMAKIFSDMSKQLAETNFLLSSIKNGWQVPEEITN